MGPGMTAERQMRFWLIGLAVFAATLYLLSGVLLPFVAGMAVAYLLDPVCDRLERWGLSRGLATAVLTLLFLVLAVAALLLLVPLVAGQLVSLIENTPDYIDSLRGQFSHLIAGLESRIDPQLLERLRDAIAGSAGRSVEWATSMLGGVLTGGVAFVNLLSLLVITPVVAFYLLRDWDRIVTTVDSWLPRDHAVTIRRLAGEVDQRLAGFVRGQGTVCLSLGAFYAIGLSMADLQFGLVIGVVAGLLSFIPYVGAIVGMLLSVGLAMVQFDDWMRIAIVAGIFLVGQALEGYVLTPRLVGGQVGLHPVWVMFALLAGGALFGFVGMMLAVPTTAVIGVGVRFALASYLASPYYDRGSGP